MTILEKFEKQLKMALSEYKLDKNKECFTEKVGTAILHYLAVDEGVNRDIAFQCFEILRKK